MACINPYTLRMQISRMFEQGQSFFAITKVQDWLRERKENPLDYEIYFHQKPAPEKTDLSKIVEIELRRKDGNPVDTWLQEEIKRY